MTPAKREHKRIASKSGGTNLHIALLKPTASECTLQKQDREWCSAMAFQKSWDSWRHQLEALAKEGFRAIAPDMRGYGQTDKPEGDRPSSRDDNTYRRQD
jgi:hypothetical protein